MEQCNIKDPVPLPNGTYDCSWGGYEVWLEVIGIVNAPNAFNRDAEPMGFILRLHSSMGIRTPCAQAFLTVKDGLGFVEVVIDKE